MKPQGLVMITDDGSRIPVDFRLVGNDADGIRYWEPVVEGDLNALMPSVVAFDGPRLNTGEAITFIKPGPGWDNPEWGERVMENSRNVFNYYNRDDVQIERG